MGQSGGRHVESVAFAMEVWVGGAGNQWACVCVCVCVCKKATADGASVEW